MSKTQITFKIGSFAAMMMIAGTAFAGGSSMLWKVTGSQMAATPGQTLANALMVHMENYFNDPTIKDVQFGSITIACSGGNIFSGADLKSNGQVMGTANFSSAGGWNTATILPQKLIITDNTKMDFSVDLMVRSDASMAQDAQCAVQNVVLMNAANNSQIYNSGDAEGYVYAENSQSAAVTFGGAKLQTVPFKQLYNSQYGQKFQGSGRITAKFLGKSTDNLGTDTNEYLINVFGFDQNFSDVAKNYGKTRPVKLYLTISAADAANLSTTHLIRLQVRDFYYMSSNGDYPWGYVTFVK